MTAQALVHWLGFQLVWLVSALGAARGQWVPGIVAAAVFLAVVLASNRQSRALQIFMIVASGLLGFIAESALIASGLVAYSAPWPNASLAPAWVVAIWLSFGATLSNLISALGHRPLVKACIAGAIAGPMAYWAGLRLEALQIIDPPELAYLAIGLMWSAVMPALIALHSHRLRST